MVLPPFTPTGGIVPAVGLLPMQEPSGVANRNRQFDLPSQIGALIQTCITAWHIEARSSLNAERDFITAELESQTGTRIGVVTHIHPV